MAEKKTAEPAPEKEKRVRIRLFRDHDKYKDDVVIGVNGRFIKIQRGVEVEIPKSYAAVLEQSEAQDAKTARLIDSKVREGEIAAAALR